MNHPAFVKRLRAGLKSDETGNKANSLIFLHRYGFNIPLTFLVTTCAYDRYLKEGSVVIEELREEILHLPDVTYAVRSSTTAEDSKEYSYAGQFQTLMNIRGTENILKAVQEVWNSSSLLGDNEYLRKTKISTFKCGVIIQEMIASKLAGVSFSRNPVTNQQEIVIEAVEGFGEELVQKGITPLRWRIRKDLVLDGNKSHHYFSVIRHVADDTAKLKKNYGSHIDIEWAYDGKKIYYLQLRQITGRKDIQIYSNKMAKEMLPGQIKPLVWSVNIPMVNGTWIGILSEITGTLDIKPEDLAKPFYYQTYFNIAALGKIFNKFGMSADSLEYLMMGNDNSRPSFKPGLKSLRHTFRIIRFIYTKLRFEKTFLSDYSELREKYVKIEESLKEKLMINSYPDIYLTLFNEGKRLAYLNIVTPMLMSYFHKKLKKQLEKVNLDYDKLDFREDFPQLISYTPLPSIQKIKKQIDNLPENLKEKCVSLEELRSVKEASDIVREFDRFLKDFGHLSESGNDFSFPKWEEDPELVYKMIMSSSPYENRSGMYSLNEMQQKGFRISRSLSKIYKKAGNFKVYREQISSLYIFGYGLFRRLFIMLGKDLAGRGIIDSEHDIFFLRKEEIDSILENNPAVHVNRYQDVIQKRKNEMAETKDIVLPQVIYGEEAPILEKGREKNHSGISTSSGIYRGKTRVVQKTEDFTAVQKGDVLLIPFSDVSWTSIIVKAGAIVSETGGMLSHCSIIAREMGIPALVSVENACALGSGLTVTVDGSNGVLTIHDYE
ncbi:MAG: PEP-utilizing enzyme [Bacteroidales bacterium]|jgi:pyruvate,water dikinase|nr:PEP-utilizing enzyme [Bacteroidales bacterium]